MESKTEFDLNLNLQRWREDLADSPSFQPGNLDELEVHLRDSVSTLEAKGLSTEESFLIATRRIGHPSALEKEFGKVNSEAVWLSRWMWMAIGVFLFLCIENLKLIANGGLLWLGKHFHINAYALGFLSIVTTVALFATAIVLLRRLAAPGLKSRGHFITRNILNRPRLSMVGLVILGISLSALSTFMQVGTFSTEQLNLLRIVYTWSLLPYYVAQLILLPAAIVYFYRRQLKARLELT